MTKATEAEKLAEDQAAGIAGELYYRMNLLARQIAVERGLDPSSNALHQSVVEASLMLAAVTQVDTMCGLIEANPFDELHDLLANDMPKDIRDTRHWDDRVKRWAFTLAEAADYDITNSEVLH